MENQNLNFDFVFLGQSILKYQVPLDIFSAINQTYEQNFHRLAPANKQLVGKIENEHRSEEHTSELQSRLHLVCRLQLEKKKKQNRRVKQT